ncbi:MAG: DUF4184 family protein [Candidatus Thorarchaeota archaeon]|nr:MAG: DUF4184 family protein [Candidatus Thorarchaeota archaeon]
MPFTLFHYVFAWAVAKLDRRFSLPALFVGSVMPDVEVPIIRLFFSEVVPDHYVLHSLIQTLTLGLLLSVLVVRFLYPPVISRLFGVDRCALDESCSVAPALILSCAIGLAGHLILDYPMHYYNHIFWPFVDPNILVGPLVAIFAIENDLDLGYIRANVAMNTVMILLFTLVLLKIRGPGFWERFWLGESEMKEGALANQSTME